MTAEDIWRKDRIYDNYLKSKGYTVIRFWEKEIKYEIDKCIQIIRSRIQAYEKKRIKQIRSHCSDGMDITQLS